MPPAKTTPEQAQSVLGTVADLVTLKPLAVSLTTSVAAATAPSYGVRSPWFIVLLVVTAVAFGVMAFRRVFAFAWRWLRFKLTTTTVELHGGHSLTLVIKRDGQPVKVRARAEFVEFGEEMAIHPAPYDLELFTSVKGGRFNLIAMNPSFNMATSIFGHLEKLADDAAMFRVERPGFPAFQTVVQTVSKVIPYSTYAHLRITVTVVAPEVGSTTIHKRYRLFVSHKQIEIVDDTHGLRRRRLFGYLRKLVDKAGLQRHSDD